MGKQTIPGSDGWWNGWKNTVSCSTVKISTEMQEMMFANCVLFVFDQGAFLHQLQHSLIGNGDAVPRALKLD
jgi:hypothetical protein